MKKDMPGDIPENIRMLLLKQDGTALSATESQQLNEWYEALELVPVDNLLEGSTGEANEKELIWQALNSRIQREAPARVYRMKPWLWKAAAVAILAGLSAAWLWYRQDPYRLEVATNTGKLQHVVLPDGSQVWLNAKSRLQYNNWAPGKAREVVLNGEAFFDIAQNAHQPFIIHTQTVDIRVLGTSFNVKAYNDDSHTETTLVTGMVQIVMKQEDGRTVTLAPNQKLVVQNREELKKITTVNTNKIQIPDSVNYHITVAKIIAGDSSVAEISWRERKLTFFDQPLSEVALQLERWYGVAVIFKEETMKNARFTGTFRDESLPKVMEVLQMSAPFNYHISNDTLMINK
jgi:transmembrane sensor